ncbi:transposase [uncultured Fusobacterium sp.]|uniref:IS110 family transposase n=1 Tax=uncultured Fusobacterium sp. TaxID=159267 RepID=UPI00259562B4|nr:transposase [uncultured Fusobacterium sp.]
MFYLGIDIGKNIHAASLIDDKKKVIFKAFSFSNSIDGANSLLEKLSPFIQFLEIGMETTRHYWLSIYSFFVEKTFLPMLSILFRLTVDVMVSKLEKEKLISLILF